MDYGSDSTESSVEADRPDSAPAGSSKVLCVRNDHQSVSDKLRYAASCGQVDQLRHLLTAGVASFESDAEGHSALYHAAAGGHTEAVRLLITAGADINQRDQLGYTALHQAACRGHVEVIRTLVVAGSQLDCHDFTHGNTALHDAAWNGFSSSVQLLVTCGANVHLVNKAGFSALHLAAQNGHNQCARVLLFAGCRTQHKNNYGDTALHTAARYGHAGVTRILIGARCAVNECNKNRDTALHIAAALKRSKIAKLLVDAGVDIHILNRQGETAVDVARRKQHVEIIHLLVSSQHSCPSSGHPGNSYATLDSNKGIKSDDDDESCDDKKKKKKKKKSKGFFFRRKKHKNKAASDGSDNTASNSKHVQQSEVIGGGQRSTAPSFQTHHPPLQSRQLAVAADEFYRVNPDELVLGFRRHRMTQQRVILNSSRDQPVSSRQEPLGRIAVPHHSEHLPPRPTLQQICSVSPRRHVHHGNSCQDDELRQFLHDDEGRPATQGVAGGHLIPEGIPVEGRLVRSRSDETLSNLSLIPRRRPSTTLRRRKKLNLVADRLISDFNEGKEVDLDNLAGQGQGAGGSDDVGAQDTKSADTGQMSARANVRNWLETQNYVGGSSSQRTRPDAKHYSLDVHHL